MTGSLLLRHEEKHGKAFVAIEKFLEWMTNGYRRVLAASLASHTTASPISSGSPMRGMG